jgi:hypothetical protein
VGLVVLTLDESSVLSVEEGLSVLIELELDDHVGWVEEVSTISCSRLFRD